MQEYQNAVDDLNTATELNVLQRDLSNATAGAADAEAQPEAARVRRELGAMAADFERGRALADAYTALANLYIATGVDLVAPDVDISDLATLTDSVRQAIAPWTHGEMPRPLPVAVATEQPGAADAAGKARDASPAGVPQASAPSVSQAPVKLAQATPR